MMNCIGVDYAPPTPAPSNHHIIGDDDDVSPASGGRGGPGHGVAPGSINPATALYQGLHPQHIPNLHNPVKRNSGPPSMPKPPPPNRQPQNIPQV